MKKGFSLVLVLLFLAATATSALALDYPTRQVELIAPYSAGGGVDTNCRALAPALEAELGQTVLVVNKPGAGGVIGFTYIGTAKADGYTLGLAALSSITTNAALGDFSLDPRECYDYLGGVVFDPSAICVSKSSPFNTLQELVDYAKEQPFELSYGGTGDLSLDAMVCRDLMRAAGVDINLVNFESGSEALASLMGGHIDIMGGTYSEMNGYYEDGEVKILAVGEETAGFPSFESCGYKLSCTGARRTVMAPKGLSDEVLARLREAVKAAVESEDFRERAETNGLTPAYAEPEKIAEEAGALMDFFLNNDFGI